MVLGSCPRKEGYYDYSKEASCKADYLVLDKRDITHEAEENTNEKRIHPDYCSYWSQWTLLYSFERENLCHYAESP